MVLICGVWEGVLGGLMVCVGGGGEEKEYSGFSGLYIVMDGV